MITSSANFVTAAIEYKPLSDADLSSIASTYASFAEIMTGFSFAALAIYLAYEYATGKHSREEGATSKCADRRCEHRTRFPHPFQKGEHPVEVVRNHPIKRAEIGATLAFSIASLAMSSFLYASLTSQVGQPQKFADELLLYGVVFGTSVLALFYSITLMMYTNPSTTQAAWAAFWIVVFVGPAVVFRFLAGAAQGAWEAWYQGSGSSSWTWPEIIGDVGLIVLPAGSWAVYRMKVLEKDSKLESICRWLCIYVVQPAFGIFILAAIVTAVSIFSLQPVHIASPKLFIMLSMIGGLVLLAFFALACGCIIGPRLPSLKDSRQRSAEAEREFMRADTASRSQAYSEFIGRYLAVQHTVGSRYAKRDSWPSPGDITALLQSVREGAARVIYTAKSEKTYEACLGLLGVLQIIQAFVCENENHVSRSRPELIMEIEDAMREFCDAAREELGLNTYNGSQPDISGPAREY